MPPANRMVPAAMRRRRPPRNRGRLTLDRTRQFPYVPRCPPARAKPFSSRRWAIPSNAVAPAPASPRLNMLGPIGRARATGCGDRWRYRRLLPRTNHCRCRARHTAPSRTHGRQQTPHVADTAEASGATARPRREHHHGNDYPEPLAGRCFAKFPSCFPANPSRRDPPRAFVHPSAAIGAFRRARRSRAMTKRRVLCGWVNFNRRVAAHDPLPAMPLAAGDWG